VNYEPKQVDYARLGAWFLESVELVRRRPLAWLVLGAIFLTPFIVDWIRADIATIMTAFMMPFALCAGVVISSSADNDLVVYNTLTMIDKKRLMRLVLLGAILALVESILILVGLIAIHTGLIPNPIAFESAAAEIRNGSVIPIAVFSPRFPLIFGTIVMGILTLYIVPLIVIDGLSEVDSWYQCRQCDLLNIHVNSTIIILFLAVAAGVMVWPFIAAVWPIVCGTLLYVSHRDIWYCRDKHESV